MYTEKASVGHGRAIRVLPAVARGAKKFRPAATRDRPATPPRASGGPSTKPGRSAQRAASDAQSSVVWPVMRLTGCSLTILMSGAAVIADRSCGVMKMNWRWLSFRAISHTV